MPSFSNLIDIQPARFGKCANTRFRVALVYPPFAPFGIASLGLSVLAAGIRELGLDCKVFYWNVDTVRHIPHADRKTIYQNLSVHGLFPANEWIYSRILFPEHSVMSRAAVERSVRRNNDHPGIDEYWRLILTLEESSEEMVTEMRDRLASYDLIGINTSFFQNAPALALARKVKEAWPEKYVALGGANCHGGMGVALAEKFDFLDFVFLGEADFDFPELVRCLADNRPFSHVGGVVERRGQSLAAHPPSPPVEELDKTPFPVFDDYIEQVLALGLNRRENILLPLEISRGCWWGEKHHCTFCGLNAEGMHYRKKSHGRFRAEVEQISEAHGIRYFFMTDNILEASPANGLLDWNREREPKLNFFFEIRPSAKREQVSELVNLGVTMVQPGIEHFSTKTLLLMQKNLQGIGNVAFLKYAREYGLWPVYNLLCQFPGECPEEYAELARNLAKIAHLAPPNGLSPIQYHRFSPYHTSPDKYGLTLRPFHGYSLIYPFEQDQIARLAYLFEAENSSDAAPLASYLLETQRAVKRWRDHYAEDACALTWAPVSDEMVIEDRRPGFRRAEYSLHAAALDVFSAFDQPRSLAAVVREFEHVSDGDWFASLVQRYPGTNGANGGNPKGKGNAWLEMQQFGIYSFLGPTPEQRTIRFSRAEFLSDPSRHVRVFLDASIFLQEGDRLLALPVYKGGKTADPQWKRFDV